MSKHGRMIITSTVKISPNMDGFTSEFFPVEVTYNYTMTDGVITWDSVAHEISESVELVKREMTKRHGKGLRFVVSI